MKYLVLIAVLVIAFAIWSQQRRREQAERSAPAPRPTRAVAPPQDMVACAHCGLHLPAKDAISQGKLYFCSAEHRRLGVNR